MQLVKFSRIVLMLALMLGGFTAAAMAGETKARERTPPFHGFKIGVASYTFRMFSLDDAIKMTNELGVKYISLKDAHLPLKSTPEQCAEAGRKVKAAGLILTSGGVINFRKTSETAVRAAFEYAKNAGMPMITAMPDRAALPLLDKMIKEYDIKIAIHNHGPDDIFPSPLDAYEAIQPYDKRMGICIDIGHSVRNGDDEIADIHKVADRLYDFHLKDVNKREKSGTTVVMGTGVIKLVEVFKALAEVGYDGPLNMEYEPEGKNPLPAMQGNVEYLKEMLPREFGARP